MAGQQDIGTPEGEAAVRRLVSQDVMTEHVQEDGSSPALRAGSLSLASTGAIEVGVWDAGPGADVDVEADELFLVLAGAGTVTFDDGSVLTLGPGTLVRLYAGDRTTWEVTRRLRKLYIVGGPHHAETGNRSPA